MQMTCAGSYQNLAWNNIVYTPLAEWQKVLSKLTTREIHKGLSTKSDPYHRPTTHQYSSSTIRNQARLASSKNHLADDSFTSSVEQSSKDVSRQVTLSARRYVSSFKTMIGPLNSRPTPQLISSSDNAMILKTSKETDEKEHSDGSSQMSMKHSSLSMSTSTTTHGSISSSKRSLPAASTWKASLTYKAEGMKRRATHHDALVALSDSIDLSTPSNLTSTMAASATSHPSSNPSLFAYGSTMTAGNTVRHRALADSATNSLLITSERLKANTSSSMRPARQSSTTTMPAAYMTSQQLQRNASQPTRSRHQPDRSSNSKDLYQYPDPFTNCPADVLSKLAQLTKLQMETVEWERKRRFTKKKSGANGTAPGKDSP